MQAQLAKLREDYARLNPEDIKVIDPCMGSGHILVYAFDVLMQIYEAQGYTQRDAAQLIVEKNLYGLDIDKRAYQLAYFAVMMKARQYNRRILNGELRPHLYAIQDSNGINRNQLQFFGWSMGDVERNKALTQVEYLLDTFRDAKEYGSILSVDMLDWELLYRFAGTVDYSDQISLDELNLEATKDALWTLVEQGAVLAQKYDVVVTNPPYMGASGMNARLSQYVKDHFPDTKADLFSCFIERGFQLANVPGFVSMITMESWMFLSSFEKMRQNIVNTHTIVNMVHMPYLGKGGTSLGINFGTAAVIFNKRYCRDYNSQFDYICYYETDENGVPFAFPTVNERYKAAKATNFSKIPGSPVAYWVSKRVMSLFEYPDIKSMVLFRQGMATSDNNRFLRKWYEVSLANFFASAKSLLEAKESAHKWFPYNKGGEYRKWYGNHEYCVNWENDGQEMKAYTATLPQGMNVRLKSREYYFKPEISWSAVTSGNLSVRFYPCGFIFDTAGGCIFNCAGHEMFFLALLNAKIGGLVMGAINPTINNTLEDMKKIPVIFDSEAEISTMAKECVRISEVDWNSKKPFLYLFWTGTLMKTRGISSGIRWCERRSSIWDFWEI